MSLRVAIAHEWLVRFAGSERCVSEMLELFPDARLLTTVVAPDRLPLELRCARPSLLQHIPGARDHHEWLLPFMPVAWRLMEPQRDVDVVISSSHACAKAVPIADGIPHLCYCHTPMRYAWSFDAEQARFPRSLRPLARLGAAWFRAWDARTAVSVTRFLANSQAVAERIQRCYGRTAEVVHPPVRTDFFTPGGTRDDFFLYVGRFVAYKRPELVVEAFADLPDRLVMVGSGQMESRLRSRATANIEFVTDADDDRLRDLYRSARALVYPGEEDFGIVMAEAQACGTPVIALAAGGALDIVEPGLNGWFVADQTPTELRRAIEIADGEMLDAAEIRRSALRFGAARFRGEIAAAVERAVSETTEEQIAVGWRVSRARSVGAAS
ncbi:MAG: glycosyl transferase group 1 [Actinomycetia bacterium]|nr:glycosyl transferase group 1 [Actinomycetes bacterium]